MVAFLDPAEVPKISRAEFVEIFSGKARTSKVASWSGYRSKAVDFLYNPALNVFNAAGFTFLDSSLFPAHRCFRMKVNFQYLKFFNLDHLSLCLALILFGDAHLVSLLATECSTFVHVNSGTSKRSVALPGGNPECPSVRRGNALAAHSSLMILLLCLIGATFLLEQPGSSVLMQTKRMQWVIAVLESIGIRIFRQAFWMSCWGHWSPKRTILWSNNRAVAIFTTDKVAKTPLPKGPSTVDRYISKKTGKSGYQGNRHLKSTEHLEV